MAYNSKYTGEQVEEMLDMIANGEAGGGGGITIETDPVFSASPAASITEEKKSEWDDKVDKDQLVWTQVDDEAGVRLKGTNGTATGNLAISAGDDKTASDGTAFASAASGDHAVAFGYGNTCAGRTTLAQGLYNIVNGKDSVAFGQRNLVNGDQAFAAGQQNEVTTRLGVAIGYKNKATNTDSVAIGYQNTSSGSASVAMGDTCEANGTSSTAMGYKTKATGAYSSTFGENTQATNEGEVAMGLYNKSTTSTDASEQTAFSFGIGTSDTNRTNAFEIKKNGDVYIGDKMLSDFAGGSNANRSILTCEFMGEVGDIIWSDDDQGRIDYIADWMEALSMGKVCVLDFDDYEGTYAMVHAINYRNDATYGIGKVYFSYIFEGYLYDIEYESVSLPVTMTIVSKTKIGDEGGSNTDGGTEPMVCAYRITSYTANHIELENYTYNGQTMYYREGAIISILNPNSADVVFEGGTLTLTLDGNEYEASAFTIKSGATALFSLGPDPGVLLPISSVVESNSGGSSEGGGSTTKEVVMVGGDTIDLLEPNKVYILLVPQTTLQISDIVYPDDNYAEYCIMVMKGVAFSNEPFEPQPMSLLLPADYQFYWAGESQDSLTTGDTWELSIVYTASALTEGFKCVLTKFT